MLKTSGIILCLILSLLLACSTAIGQSTSFTLQGKLNDGGIAANGTYDMQFKLYRSAAVIQVGPTITIAAVQVTNGIFTVRLDFGAVFDGTDRSVEVGIRPAGSNAAYTLLSPKTPITTAPHSIQANAALTADLATTANTATNANDAAKLGGIAAASYVQTSDPRLGDARTPLPGSSDYVQNRVTPQPNSAFSVSGNGTVGGTLSANAVDTKTNFTLNGVTVLRFPGDDNIFLGRGAGENDFGGIANTLVGNQSGQSTTSAVFNTFVGASSGNKTTFGSNNSFFGYSAGKENVSGRKNAFFGVTAGVSNTTGSFNSYFGSDSGVLTTTGSSNSFFGYGAGVSNTTGNGNTFIGANTNGSGGVSNSTAIGAGAQVSRSNQMVLGTNAETVEVPGDLTVFGTLTANLPSGSTNYIQNTQAQQADANFNIAGNGRVGGTFSASTVALNDGMLRLRNAVDSSQGMLYDPIIDGTEFRGSFGFRWTYGVNGANEAMRVTSNGFLGIGTNTPTERFSVIGNGTVSGKVTANNFSASSDYQIGGISILRVSAGTNTTILGNDSGGALNGGIQNTFLGSLTGNATTTGNYNTFAGTGAGLSNTTGSQNSYFGNGAGQNSVNVTGNSYFGYGAGFQAKGGSNSFFGNRSGFNAASGDSNSFFGANTGESNAGNENSFFGFQAGFANTSGRSNTFIGSTAGNENTTGIRNVFVGTGAGGSVTTGKNNTYVGWLSALSATTEDNNTLIGSRTDISPGIFHSTAIGADATVTGSNQIVLGSNLDVVRMPGIGVGGSTNVCVDANRLVLICSSSLRFKTNIQPYARSLDVISKLRPIAFEWKNGGMKDVGFGAEDVAKVDPLLVTYDDKGAVVGVKYDRLSTIFVNAFREQQDEIAKQKELIDAQRRKLAAQDDAIASLGRRLEQLAQQVGRKNSLRQSQTSTRRRAHTKSRR